LGPNQDRAVWLLYQLPAGSVANPTHDWVKSVDLPPILRLAEKQLIRFQLLLWLEVLMTGLPEQESILSGEIFEGDDFFLREVAAVIVDLQQDGLA
jgi:hypothetical protein